MSKETYFKREVWAVEISETNGFAQEVYHVFANSAARAEKRGLEIAVADKDHHFSKPYCISAAFAFYVY